MTQEEKAKRYDEALIRGSRLWESDMITRENYEYMFPEIEENEDERIRKDIISYLKSSTAISPKTWIAWLEKQCEKGTNGNEREIPNSEQKPIMIQWQGDNLKEVIAFTGKAPQFDKWFKTFDEYEQYVHNHNKIFKLFNEDGSHYEVPVGAWIVKTPDGYNVASNAVYKKKPAEWSEEDSLMIDETIYFIDEFQKSDRCKNENDMQNSVTCKNWLKALKDRVGCEVNCTTTKNWSEEDEELLESWYDKLISMSVTYQSMGHGENATYLRRIANWLKSIKYKVQPKQEWSEEDKYNHNIILCLLNNECVGREDKRIAIEWFKSLRPQNHWKPTEEQLKGLAYAMSAYNGAFTDIIKSLYNDLKKL